MRISQIYLQLAKLSERQSDRTVAEDYIYILSKLIEHLFKHSIASVNSVKDAENLFGAAVGDAIQVTATWMELFTDCTDRSMDWLMIPSVLLDDLQTGRDRDKICENSIKDLGDKCFQISTREWGVIVGDAEFAVKRVSRLLSNSRLDTRRGGAGSGQLTSGDLGAERVDGFAQWPHADDSPVRSGSNDFVSIAKSKLFKPMDYHLTFDQLLDKHQRTAALKRSQGDYFDLVSHVGSFPASGTPYVMYAGGGDGILVLKATNFEYLEFKGDVESDSLVVLRSRGLDSKKLLDTAALIANAFAADVDMCLVKILLETTRDYQAFELAVNYLLYKADLDMQRKAE